MFSIFLLMDFLKLFQTNIGYRIPNIIPGTLRYPPSTYPSDLLFLGNYSDKIIPPTHGTPWNN